MKILNLGLDNSVLKENSALAKRIFDYGKLAEKYTLIVPSANYVEIKISNKAKAIGAGGQGKFSKFIKMYKVAKSALDREKYDIISVQDPYFLALAAYRLAKKFHLGLEIQIHGWEKFQGIRAKSARFLIPKAGAIRVVSQRLRKQLVDEFGVAEEKITAVPIFSEIQNSKFKNQNDNPEFKNDKFIFLTVGRLVPVKNIGMQIEAMADVIKKYPKAELWIVGDGPENEKLKVKSEKLKVNNHIKFFGWQEDLLSFYSRADVFLLTSNYEGWGLAVIEAASFGLPIIMTDVGCAGEIIKNDESGIVIPVADKDELATGMLKLIEDVHLKGKIAQGARQALINLPDKDQTLKLYVKSWQKAAENKL